MTVEDHQREEPRSEDPREWDFFRERPQKDGWQRLHSAGARIQGAIEYEKEFAGPNWTLKSLISKAGQGESLKVYAELDFIIHSGDKASGVLIEITNEHPKSRELGDTLFFSIDYGDPLPAEGKEPDESNTAFLIFEGGALHTEEEAAEFADEIVEEEEDSPIMVEVLQRLDVDESLERELLTFKTMEALYNFANDGPTGDILKCFVFASAEDEAKQRPRLVRASAQRLAEDLIKYTPDDASMN